MSRCFSVDLPTSLTTFGIKPSIFIPPVYYQQFLADVQLHSQLEYPLSLPGVRHVIGLPDIHLGYSFPIGTAVAIDMDKGYVSAKGIGSDINCGVMGIATNLDQNDIQMTEALADKLQHSIEIINNKVSIDMLFNQKLKMNEILRFGVDYLCSQNIFNRTAKISIENGGSRPVSMETVFSIQMLNKAKAQLGTLGRGNHYAEIQYVDEIYSKDIAELGIKKVKQVVIMIHSGSRGIGKMVHEQFKLKDLPIETIDPYLEKMNAAANYANVNRMIIKEKIEKVLKKLFPGYKSEIIYDIGHNMGTVESHFGEQLFVMRKGCSRAHRPSNPLLPSKYRFLGQPIIVGGSMGTSSYILCSSESNEFTLESCIHGSGRIFSRNEMLKKKTYQEVKTQMEGIAVRYGTKGGLIEEAPDAYKDIDIVSNYCEEVGIANRMCRCKPMIVIKG